MTRSAMAPLLIRFGAVGDLVMAIPAMRALAQQHGRACDVVAHGAWSQALLAELPFVGSVITLDSRKWPYWLSLSQQRVVRFLAARREAPTWLFETDRKSEALCRRAGIQLSNSIAMAGSRADEHQVDMHRRLIGRADDAAYQRAPQLIVSAAERSACQAWMQAASIAAQPILIHPGNKLTQRGSSRNHKAWPSDRWVSLIRELRRRQPATTVLLTGSASERELTMHIVRAVADPLVRSVAGETPLRRLMALDTLAHSCISVDTGPAHVAAALGCRLVVLFGRTDPRVNGPITVADTCRIVIGPADAPVLSGERGWWQHHSMDDIHVEAVLDAWTQITAMG